MYYDKEGNELTLHEWAQLIEGIEHDDPNDYRRVAQDKIGKAWVSTVWLGIDHNFGWTGPPLIFETMIFGGKHDGEQWRYHTLEAAKLGHRAEVVKLKVERGQRWATIGLALVVIGVIVELIAVLR